LSGKPKPQGFTPAKLSAAADETLKLDERAEEEFDLWCFLQDLYDIRQHLRGVWTEYRDGHLSFFAACAVTDTAFGLMRRAENDLAKAHPRFDDPDSILGFLGLRCAGVPQGRPCFTSVEDGGAVVLEDVSKATMLLCPSASFVLHFILETWKEAGKLISNLSRSEQPEEFNGHAAASDTIYNACIEGFVAEHHVSASAPEKPDRDQARNDFNAAMDKYHALLSYHPFVQSSFRLVMEVEVMFSSAAYDVCAKRIDEFVDGLAWMHKHQVVPIRLADVRMQLCLLEALSLIN